MVTGMATLLLYLALMTLAASYTMPRLHITPRLLSHLEIERIKKPSNLQCCDGPILKIEFPLVKDTENISVWDKLCIAGTTYNVTSVGNSTNSSWVRINTKGTDLVNVRGKITKNECPTKNMPMCCVEWKVPPGNTTDYSFDNAEIYKGCRTGNDSQACCGNGLFRDCSQASRAGTVQGFNRECTTPRFTGDLNKYYQSWRTHDLCNSCYDNDAQIYSDSNSSVHNCTHAKYQGFCNESFTQEYAASHNTFIPSNWGRNLCPIACGEPKCLSRIQEDGDDKDNDNDRICANDDHKVRIDSQGSLQNCSNAAMKGFCNNSFAQEHATSNNIYISQNWLRETCPLACGACNSCNISETRMCPSAANDNSTTMFVECVGKNESRIQMSNNATLETCTIAIQAAGGEFDYFAQHSCQDGSEFLSGRGKGQEFFCPGALDRNLWQNWMQSCGCTQNNDSSTISSNLSPSSSSTSAHTINTIDVSPSPVNIIPNTPSSTPSPSPVAANVTASSFPSSSSSVEDDEGFFLFLAGAPRSRVATWELSLGVILVVALF